MSRQHIISVLLENEAGALSRVSGLFSARAYNIESLTVAPTQDPTLSRLTLVTVGNDETIEQIKKQLNKLIDVVKLIDLSESFSLERELVLLKVKKNDAMLQKIDSLGTDSSARITDETDGYLIVELSGEKAWLDDFLSSLENEVIDVVRTGVIGLSRGERSLTL
ncbi:MAG: acetolactate synthase-1/3 small subunit [Cycloclasticus pugetii]|jgi:acetolactate synthase-1/3 small subunit|uniref:Acetolactate synthase small subunit n=2 Tax=Cycloclasticus TaxID=34067 RepID=S5U0Q8_9GAMM|nr:MULTISPECIES: acetolactate synthase small subunit [Cycloclasticus]AGS40788.1 Acetolactate synthase I/III small subunit [Cycloclasticus zancles 78-ME]ATI01977.1 acetolactate synthase small subunit [Cycloclasticus sp. PY97N]EPD13281.1 acetolactate synthase small subunit [Cycloclasticus pugetii]MBV1899330.1 acetolactate synthase small subunit [Cycloclasticus sp.]MDF1829470.1 acetolactate synthase small subunit [Cycloclasticus pugetii]|tara:strand:+ start:323 stop:817 length:495 start_codon:yes stop_codon:yes gene_type:complete